MNDFLLALVWLIGFFIVTRLISVVGGKYHRYFRSSMNQDLVISMILSILVVFAL